MWRNLDFLQNDSFKIGGSGFKKDSMPGSIEKGTFAIGRQKYQNAIFRVLKPL